MTQHYKTIRTQNLPIRACLSLRFIHFSGTLSITCNFTAFNKYRNYWQVRTVRRVRSFSYFWEHPPLRFNIQCTAVCSTKLSRFLHFINIPYDRIILIFVQNKQNMFRWIPQNFLWFLLVMCLTVGALTKITHNVIGYITLRNLSLFL